jgi:hypothetical protein
MPKHSLGKRRLGSFAHGADSP